MKLAKSGALFQKGKRPQLQALAALIILSIPVSHASVERVFSVMGNVWTDEHNRLSTLYAAS